MTCAWGLLPCEVPSSCLSHDAIKSNRGYDSDFNPATNSIHLFWPTCRVWGWVGGLFSRSLPDLKVLTLCFKTRHWFWSYAVETLWWGFAELGLGMDYLYKALNAHGERIAGDLVPLSIIEYPFQAHVKTSWAERCLLKRAGWQGELTHQVKVITVQDDLHRIKDGLTCLLAWVCGEEVMCNAYPPEYPEDNKQIQIDNLYLVHLLPYALEWCFMARLWRRLQWAEIMPGYMFIPGIAKTDQIPLCLFHLQTGQEGRRHFWSSRQAVTRVVSLLIIAHWKKSLLLSHVSINRRGVQDL